MSVLLAAADMATLQSGDFGLRITGPPGASMSARQSQAHQLQMLENACAQAQSDIKSATDKLAKRMAEAEAAVDDILRDIAAAVECPDESSLAEQDSAEEAIDEFLAELAEKVEQEEAEVRNCD